MKINEIIKNMLVSLQKKSNCKKKSYRNTEKLLRELENFPNGDKTKS